LQSADSNEDQVITVSAPSTRASIPRIAVATIIVPTRSLLPLAESHFSSQLIKAFDVWCPEEAFACRKQLATLAFD